MTTSPISPRASTAAEAVIEVAHVSFAYDGERVLDDVTFAVRRGAFVGVIGPNGSGKSTLLRVILGRLRPTQGEVRLFGARVDAFREWWRVGYVPQKAVAFETRFPATVGEVVHSGLVARRGRLGPARERDAVRRALGIVGLEGEHDRLIGRLSVGQQQRAFIARALVSEPELLILDEPLVGVDVEAEERFYALLQRLNRDLGTTLVMVSHDIGMIAREVNQMACLNRTLVAHGTPEECLDSGVLARLYGPDARIVVHHHH